MKAHDFVKDDQVDLEHTEPVFVSLLSGQSCECASSKERTVRQLKEEAQQNLGIAIKSLIGPNMEVLDEEKTLEDENIVPGTRLTLVAVNQEAEDEKEAAKYDNDIHWAARDGRLGAVRHLLRTRPGAVAATTGLGGTALHFAAHFGRAEVARLLLAAGAQVDARDTRGSTPLHFAASNGQAEVVKVLLEAKASTTAIDGGGKTPLDNARSKGHNEIVTILERAA